MARRTAQPKKPDGEAKLNERQRRFVEAYMGKAAGNATMAAKIAGYEGGDASLAVTASRLLRQANVRKAMGERASEDPAVADRKERQAFWSRMMRGEPIAQVTSSGETVTGPAAAKDRLKASELLGKAQGDFIERHEVSLSVNLSRLTDDQLARLAAGEDPAKVLGQDVDG